MMRVSIWLILLQVFCIESKVITFNATIEKPLETGCWTIFNNSKVSETEVGSSISLELCQSRCKLNPKCIGFNHYHDNHSCSFQEGASDIAPSDAVDYWEVDRECLTVDCTYAFVISTGHRLPNGIPLPNVRTNWECRFRCLRDRRCRAVTWYPWLESGTIRCFHQLEKADAVLPEPFAVTYLFDRSNCKEDPDRATPRKRIRRFTNQKKTPRSQEQNIATANEAPVATANEVPEGPGGATPNGQTERLPNSRKATKSKAKKKSRKSKKKKPGKKKRPKGKTTERAPVPKSEEKEEKKKGIFVFLPYCIVGGVLVLIIILTTVAIVVIKHKHKHAQKKEEEMKLLEPNKVHSMAGSMAGDKTTNPPGPTPSGRAINLYGPTASFHAVNPPEPATSGNLSNPPGWTASGNAGNPPGPTAGGGTINPHPHPHPPGPIAGGGTINPHPPGP